MCLERYSQRSANFGYAPKSSKGIPNVKQQNGVKRIFYDRIYCGGKLFLALSPVEYVNNAQMFAIKSCFIHFSVKFQNLLAISV